MLLFLTYQHDEGRPNMICYTYGQVYEYYATVCRMFSGRGLKLLKTDTHNESNIWNHSIPLAPILAEGNDLTCMEIDRATLDLARANFPDINMLEGDIRAPLANADYDVILDFSTIDHVSSDEYRGVLANYKVNSACTSIIVWLSSTQESNEGQSYFDNFEFRQHLHDLHGHIREALVFADHNAALVHFLCGAPDAVKGFGELFETIDISALHQRNKTAQSFEPAQAFPLVRKMVESAASRKDWTTALSLASLGSIDFPDHLQMVLLGPRILRQMGSHEEALAALDEVSSVHDDPLIDLERSLAFKNLGRLDEARAAWESLVAVGLDGPQVALLGSEIARLSSDLEAALELARKGRDSFPDHNGLKNQVERLVRRIGT